MENGTKFGRGFTLWFTGLIGGWQDDDSGDRRARAQEPHPQDRGIWTGTS